MDYKEFTFLLIILFSDFYIFKNWLDISAFVNYPGENKNGVFLCE